MKLVISLRIKEMIKEELPREKTIHFGIESLNNYELLSILLRCGTKEKSVIELSIEVLKVIYEIDDITNLTLNELLKIKGIGVSKATTILASIELVRRLLQNKNNKIKVPSPKLIFEKFKNIYLGINQERLYAIYLNTKCEIISEKLISIGNINSSILDDLAIFKWAYNYSASAIILVHNHPSGDPKPSNEDITATKQLIEKAKLLNFIILDHIIIGKTYFSFKANFNLWT